MKTQLRLLEAEIELVIGGIGSISGRLDELVEDASAVVRGRAARLLAEHALILRDHRRFARAVTTLRNVSNRDDPNAQSDADYLALWYRLEVNEGELSPEQLSENERQLFWDPPTLLHAIRLARSVTSHRKLAPLLERRLSGFDVTSQLEQAWKDEAAIIHRVLSGGDVSELFEQYTCWDTAGRTLERYWMLAALVRLAQAQDPGGPVTHTARRLFSDVCVELGLCSPGEWKAAA